MGGVSPPALTAAGASSSFISFFISTSPSSSPSTAIAFGPPPLDLFVASDAVADGAVSGLDGCSGPDSVVAATAAFEPVAVSAAAAAAAAASFLALSSLSMA